MELPSNIKITEVHISVIKNGDTIIFKDGLLTTVGSSNIKKCPFMGISIFGDTYKLGYEKVKLVEFTKPWEEKN